MTAADRTARGDLVIVDLVRELCLETLDEVRESALAAETRELLERLDGPQRARAGLVGLHALAAPGAGWGDPLVDSATREACELGARLCESLVASLRTPTTSDQD